MENVRPEQGNVAKGKTWGVTDKNLKYYYILKNGF
jgi:hypothetical protein